MKLVLQLFVFGAPALATVMTFTHGRQPLATVVNKSAARQMTSNLGARPLMQPTTAAAAAAAEEPLALIEPTEQMEMPAVVDEDNDGSSPMVFSASSFTASHRVARSRPGARSAGGGVSVSAQVVAKSVTAQVTVDGNEKSDEETALLASSAKGQMEDGVASGLETPMATSAEQSADIARSISQVLVDSSTGMVAGDDFSSLLLSAIESASGDLPVIGI